MKTSLLSLGSKVFEIVIHIRNRAYDNGLLRSYRSKLPIFCAGNVVAGGSGKSPFSQLLVSQLSSMGKSPAILMRGYGGSLAGPHLLESQNSISEVGDEAMMHYEHFFQEIPIVVSRSRADGARFIEEHQLADCIVLDDGLQHRALERDVNFLLLDISTEQSVKRWSSKQLLPLGRLREPLDAALKRTQCVVFSKRGVNDAKQLKNYHSYIPENYERICFEMQPSHFVDIFDSQKIELKNLRGAKVRAFAAIANPAIFFTFLRELGLELVSTHAYPDHHRISEDEWAASVHKDETLVVTTSKDAKKIETFLHRPGQAVVLELKGGLSEEPQNQSLATILEKALATSK